MDHVVYKDEKLEGHKSSRYQKPEDDGPETPDVDDTEISDEEVLTNVEG